MILKESVMTNRRRKASDVEATGKPPKRERLAMSRRQTNRQSEKGWQCRELVKPLRKKAGGVEATGKPPE